jgi:hypothetical protein
MNIGRKHWAVAGGHIPFETTGREPDFSSRDRLALLNASLVAAQVEIQVVYADRPQAGPYRICVAPQRLRTVRINDLIDPLPVPLDTAYALIIRSEMPIVVQFTRLDSGSASRALAGGNAYCSNS